MAEEQKAAAAPSSAPPRRDGGGGHGGGHSGGGHSGGGHGGGHSGPRREGGPGGGPGGPRRGKRQYFRKKKVCKFCVEKMDFIDYKRADILSQFVQERGKILPRRMTGVCSRHQRWLGVAIKRARNIALLPFAGSAAGTQQPRAVVPVAPGSQPAHVAPPPPATPAAPAAPAAPAPEAAPTA
jgi:small subunit ribosomal protein S18